MLRGRYDYVSAPETNTYFMKIRLLQFTLLAAIIFTAACSKSDNTSTPGTSTEPDNYPALNSVEQQLLGRWMITDVRDTSFYYDGNGALTSTYVATPRNNSDTTFNYRFMAEEQPSGPKDYNYARHGYDARRGVPGTETFGWLYDSAIAKLQIGYDESYTIISLTPTELYIVTTTTYSSSGSETQRDVYYEKFRRL